jgi:hypothetical protein
MFSYRNNPSDLIIHGSISLTSGTALIYLLSWNYVHISCLHAGRFRLNWLRVSSLSYQIVKPQEPDKSDRFENTYTFQQNVFCRSFASWFQPKNVILGSQLGLGLYTQYNNHEKITASWEANRRHYRKKLSSDNYTITYDCLVEGGAMSNDRQTRRNGKE